MELMKGGKSENTSGYSEDEGKKIDAMTEQAYALFRKWSTTTDPGMVCDAIIVAAASAVGSGFKDKDAFGRNSVRIVESFRRVMTVAFEKAEARRRFTPQG
jgi:hypothetical protein